jgi:superfamily I DNA/RNA helicase
MPRRQFYIQESELDEFQHSLVLRKITSSMVVSGCAGSGKSIIALHKAKAIQESALGTYRFIVFTRALNQYMSDGMKSLGLDAACFQYYEEWKRQGYPLADFMIVDEIQDFTKDDIDHLKRANRACFFFGDSAQSMYKAFRPTLSIPEIVGETRFEPKTLEFNYRLPKKIARLAALVGDGDGASELESRCTEEGAELPHIDEYPSLHAQLDAISTIATNRHFEDVGILLPTNDAVEAAYDYLRSKGNNVERKSSIRGNGQVNTTIDLDFSANNTNWKLMTYHSAKGLQFEAVFLPDCDESRPGNRSVLYVAITRTYQSLYIMHSGQLSPFFDAVPEDLYQTGASSVDEGSLTI